MREVVLVDSGIITDLADSKSDLFEWSITALEQLDEKYAFSINPVIYAECSIGYDTIEEVEELFNTLNFTLNEIPREALFLAAKAFIKYKRRGGVKSNVLPDFFIGAHAAVAKRILITRDKGRYSTYFPTVKLVMPRQ